MLLSKPWRSLSRITCQRRQNPQLNYIQSRHHCDIGTALQARSDTSWLMRHWYIIILADRVITLSFSPFWPSNNCQNKPFALLITIIHYPYKKPYNYQSTKMSNSSERQAEDQYEQENDASPVPGGVVDNSYTRETRGELKNQVPVQNDQQGYDDPMQPPYSNTDNQLGMFHALLEPPEWPEVNWQSRRRRRTRGSRSI